VYNPKDITAKIASKVNLVEDQAHAQAILRNCATSIKRLSEGLANVDLGGVSCDKCGRKGLGAEALGKTLAYTTKSLDGIYRLMEFAEGNADSRAEVVGLSDLLKVLTPEQFETFQGWVGASRESLELEKDDA